MKFSLLLVDLGVDSSVLSFVPFRYDRSVGSQMFRLPSRHSRPLLPVLKLSRLCLSETSMSFLVLPKASMATDKICNSWPVFFHIHQIQSLIFYPFKNMQSPLNLTFSIKIQCIVFLNPTKYDPGLDMCEGVLWGKEFSKQLSYDDKIRIIGRQNIVDVLKRANLPTYDVIDRGSNDQKWTVAPVVSIQRQESLRHDGFLECDVEVSSPTLRFCPKALRRVEHVVRVLTTEFSANVNESCGFYVQIGNRKSGFPLQTLKHFCMLTALFEHQFNTLHPPHCIGNARAKPPSAVFQGQNPWDAVATIQNCKSTLDLVLLYANSERRPDECFAYNLVPLLSRGTHRHPTIEFRQHKGTLDWREMINWVQVVGGVVDAVHHQIGGVDGLAHLISSCAFESTFTIFDLFDRLRLHRLSPFYKGEMYLHLRPEPIWVPDVAERVDAAAGEGGEWWNRVVERHRVEKLQECVRFDELEKRHELERRRVVEMRKAEPGAARGIAEEEEA